MEIRLKMQQRPRSAPADTSTTPVESCPSCGTDYTDEGSFIGGFWSGTVTNYHCWCSKCSFVCDITPGPPEGPDDAAEAISPSDAPSNRCPSCKAVFADTGGSVARRLVEDLQTAYHCRCGACAFEGTITPVERVLAHEAVE